MKRRLIFLLLNFTLIQFCYSQAPESFHYQSVIRDANGSVLSAQSISFRMSIIQGKIDGEAVYVERHETETSNSGVVNLDIGRGESLKGVFSGINWSQSPSYIMVEVDRNGGDSFELMGTSELLSVPYALHSKTADNVFSGEYGDLKNIPSLDNSTTNEIQTLSQSGQRITLSRNGGTFLLPKYSAGSGISISSSNVVSVKATTYQIGDAAHGGIVFHVNSAGTHGLVMNSILSGSGDYYEAQTAVHNPAKTGGVFFDWRLPSTDEFRLIKRNLFDKNIGRVLSTTYWTGSEIAIPADFHTDLGNGAYTFTMQNGYATFQNPKDADYTILSIRAF